MWRRGKLCFVILFLQTTVSILFTITCDYEGAADASHPHHSYSFGGEKPRDNSIERYLHHFLDYQMLPLMGLGLGFTGIPSTMISGLGFNLMIFTFSSQWSIFFPEIILQPRTRFTIGIERLLRAARTAFGVTLTTGILHGKTSPLQSLVLVVVEVPLMSLNQHVLNLWQVADVSGGLTIYLFSVYFGLGVSSALWRYTDTKRKTLKSQGERELTTMVGTLFIYCILPSVASCLTVGHKKHRVVINCYLALSGSCLASYAVSSFQDSRDRFSVRHIRIGTISGGVVVACIGDFMLYPYTAFILGAAMGIASCLAHIYLSPFLLARFRIHDTLSIHASIGIPAVFSGLFSAVFAAIASEQEYGNTLYQIFPARAPLSNSSDLEEIRTHLDGIVGGRARTGSEQGLYQAAGLLSTWLISTVTGVLTGILLLQPVFDPPDEIELFQDTIYWVLANEQDENFGQGSLCETETSPEDVALNDINCGDLIRSSRKVSRCSIVEFPNSSSTASAMFMDRSC